MYEHQVYRTASAAPPNGVATLALREWAGLAGYYFTGRIDEMLPGPETIGPQVPDTTRSD